MPEEVKETEEERIRKLREAYIDGMRKKRFEAEVEEKSKNPLYRGTLWIP